MKKNDWIKLRAKAFFGNREAMYELAHCYLYGSGVDSDISIAYKLFKKSAEKGMRDAEQFISDNFIVNKDGKVALSDDLKEHYDMVKTLLAASEAGDPFAQWLRGQNKLNNEVSDYKYQVGLFWVRKAADQNFPPALYTLGLQYWDSDSRLKCNKKEAVRLITASAKQGWMDAINFLASEISLKAALPYIKTAATKGDDQAMGMLGHLLLEGKEVPKDIESGLELWRQSAEQGNIKSIYNLALTYDNGEFGVQRDVQEAIRWYEIGVEKGDLQCMNNLGFLYQSLEKYDKAFELYSQVAKSFEGNEEVACMAMNNLGTCYKRGWGCEANPEKAQELYEQAVRLGNNAAMFNLLNFYSDDIAVSHNYEKAKEWLIKAADNGDVDAIMKVAEGYAHGILFEQNMQLSIRYYRIAAEKGNPKAMVILGQWLVAEPEMETTNETAKGYFLKAIAKQYVPAYHELGLYYCHPEHQDYAEAARNFSIAANACFPPAEYELGVCYRHGHGIPADMKKAIYWMELAANHGNNAAKNNLGIYYQHGVGVERDLNKAIKYYKESAEAGHDQSQVCLALCYFTGDGVPQDYSQAVKWFEKAAEQGEPDSQYHLYLCYSHGLGVDVDEEKAMTFLQEAAKNKWQPAVEAMERIGNEQNIASPVHINRLDLFDNLCHWSAMCLIENDVPYVIHHTCHEDRVGKPMDSMEYQRFFEDAFYECLNKATEDVAKIEHLSEDDEIMQTLTSIKDSGVMPDIVQYKTLGSNRKTFYKVYSNVMSVMGDDFSKMITLCKLTNSYGKIIVGETHCIESNGGVAINGAAFVARFQSYPLWPSELNASINEELSQHQLVEIIEQAWEKMDVQVLEPYLDARLHYGSDWVFNEMSSRAEYISYLTGKFEAIKRSGSFVKCQIDRDYETDMYSLIMCQDENNPSRMVVHVNEGRIMDIRMKRMLFPDDWENLYEERLKNAVPAAYKAIEEFLKQQHIDNSKIGWLKIEYNPLHFQHLCFAYDGNVYSVLIALVITKDEDIRHVVNLILPKDVEKQLKEAKRNNLIPCIIPLDIGTLDPLVGGLHLVHTESKMNVSLFGCDKKVKMSDWEIQNVGVNIVKDYLAKEGNEVTGACDALTCGQNIWFQDKSGRTCYVVVNTVAANNKIRLKRKIWTKMLTDNVGYEGYYAQVTLHSSSAVSYDENGNPIPLSQRDNSDNPMDVIFREDGFYVDFKGLEYIEKAADRMGVSDDPIECI